MIKPKISVVIPSYNYADYIGEAIDSVLAQTYENFEIIIVDNCSTDHTDEIVKGYCLKDSRIKFVQNDTNIGPHRNFNRGMLLSSGEFIKFLNADDKFAPTILEKFLTIMENHPNVSLVTSNRQLFGDKNEILKAPFIGMQSGRDVIARALSSHNWIGEPTTVMFRRENLSLGLLDISIAMWSDFDFFLRQLAVGDLFIVDEVLSYFRIHNKQGTFRDNSSVSQMISNQIENISYRKYALISNRFGYDFFIKDDNTLKNVLAYTRVLENCMNEFLFHEHGHSHKLRFVLVGSNWFKFLYLVIKCKVMSPIKHFLIRRKTQCIKKDR